MKKVVLTLVFSLVVVSMFAQSTATAPKRLKYVTQAPDGSISMTIYDDSRDATMRLESANTFYKYQIIDPVTGQAILTASNTGKECTIDKAKVAAGTYDIRLYTSKFVITSKIAVSAPSKLSLANQSDAVAMNDEE